MPKSVNILRRALLWCAVAVPLVLGIVVGFLVRIAVLLWAALVQGYMIGRGL